VSEPAVRVTFTKRDCNPSEGESGLPPPESRVGVQNDTDSFPGMCRVALGRGRKGSCLCPTELSFVLPQLQSYV
jgi:hypothetical protein